MQTLACPEHSNHVHALRIASSATHNTIHMKQTGARKPLGLSSQWRKYKDNGNEFGPRAHRKMLVL